MNSPALKRLAIRTYFYLEHLGWLALSACPQILRNLVFRLAFKRFGRQSTIDYRCYVRYPWKVSIGDRAMLNRGCSLFTSFAISDAEIIIGNDVAIGPNVSILSAGHDHATLTLDDTGATVRVCNHAWIGANSILLPGVEIGEGAVVGAGSVVTKSVPAWTVVAGNPAMFIKQRTVRCVKLQA